MYGFLCDDKSPLFSPLTRTLAHAANGLENKETKLSNQRCVFVALYESDHLKPMFSMEWRNRFGVYVITSSCVQFCSFFRLLHVFICVCLYFSSSFKRTFLFTIYRPNQSNWNSTRNTIATIFVVVTFGSTTKPSFLNTRLWKLAPFHFTDQRINSAQQHIHIEPYSRRIHTTFASSLCCCSMLITHSISVVLFVISPPHFHISIQRNLRPFIPNNTRQLQSQAAKSIKWFF